jgi:hypothetical protein
MPVLQAAVEFFLCLTQCPEAVRVIVADEWLDAKLFGSMLASLQLAGRCLCTWEVGGKWLRAAGNFARWTVARGLSALPCLLFRDVLLLAAAANTRTMFLHYINRLSRQAAGFLHPNGISTPPQHPPVTHL